MDPSPSKSASSLGDGGGDESNNEDGEDKSDDADGEDANIEEDLPPLCSCIYDVEYADVPDPREDDMDVEFQSAGNDTEKCLTVSDNMMAPKAPPSQDQTGNDPMWITSLSHPILLNFHGIAPLK